MTGPDDTDAVPSAVNRAVAWLVDHLDNCPRPIVPFIKQSFNLGNVEAVEAIRLARLTRDGTATD